jgi:2-aminobenzoate-CoA ligase
MFPTAHPDTFVRDRLPPREQWPLFCFDLPELRYPARLNCASELLDHSGANAIAIRSEAGDWSYAELRDTVDRLCRVLTEDLRLVPGNRVLLRGANSPMQYAAWLAVVKAGGVVVATMPMLRTRELQTIVDTAQIGLALCEPALLGELDAVRSAGSPLQRIMTWGGELEALMRDKVASFTAIATAQDDPCLLAFTSGTTGRPKATIHFHRDVLAMADTFARNLLPPQPDDVFAGTPPLAFTFGLGAELVFPLRFGASTAILRGSKPEQVLDGIARFGVTRMFTAPTAYRAMLAHIGSAAPRTVRTWISAGEHLPKATSDAWHAATGQRIVDGIGATEMIHIFVSAAGADIRPGSTGLPVPGYRVCILDEDFRPAPANTPGRLAVRGPTGCRYLADPRQTNYVVDGWNITGDTYTMDDAGYLWYQARTDDMIVSAGYNIAGPEVEAVLLEHPAVAECAVIGVPDAERGQIVKAVVVLRAPPQQAQEALTESLQTFVKARIAPYKYPRLIEYVRDLPRTATGKLQRFKLRNDGEAAR